MVFYRKLSIHNHTVMPTCVLKPSCTFFLFAYFLSLSIDAHAQQYFSIEGKVLTENGDGISFANVLLLQPDSTLVKGTITEESGAFHIANVSSGQYILMTNLVGYTPEYSQPFEIQDHHLTDMVMREGEALEEVVVTEKKPLYVQKIDRMVINVASSVVAAGGTALEILERSPGVSVNRQSGTISLSGKDGVMIMINGKISYMPLEAVILMLDGMSADNIESIELITSPPANLDAEGNAGFINIEMIKRNDLGLQGSFTLSAGYGKDYRTSDNINMNYRSEKLNIFGNYSFLINNIDQLFDVSRHIEQDSQTLYSNAVTLRDTRQRNHNLKIGADYRLDNTIIGMSINAYDNRWSMMTSNRNVDRIDNETQSFVNLNTLGKNAWKHFGTNFNITHNFSESASISVDIDFLDYKNNNPNRYENLFFDQNNDFIASNLSRSGKITPLHTWVSALDYKLKTAKSTQLQFGAKLVSSRFENDAKVEYLEDNIWKKDPTLSSMGTLNEERYALYGSMDHTFSDATSIKAGLRYEYTDTKLATETEGNIVDRQFGVLFPSIFINHKLSDYSAINLSYIKRITRPTFNDLAPFVLLLDPNTFLSGNAALQPAITNTFKFDLNHKTIFFSLQYSHQDSSIAQFQERYDDENSRLIFETGNMEYTKTFSSTLGMSFNLTPWWSIRNNIIYLYQKVRTNLYNTPFSLSMHSYQANTAQSFKISNNFTGEIVAFVNGPSFFGSAIYKSAYAINLGCQYQLKNGGIFRFNVSDLLDSFEWRGGTTVESEGLHTVNTFDFQNRTFILSFSKSFGNQNVKAARQRTREADEERSRVN